MQCSTAATAVVNLAATRARQLRVRPRLQSQTFDELPGGVQQPTAITDVRKPLGVLIVGTT